MNRTVEDILHEIRKLREESERIQKEINKWNTALSILRPQILHVTDEDSAVNVRVEDILHEIRKMREELKHLRSVNKSILACDTDFYVTGKAEARISVIDAVIFRINEILGEDEK